MQPALAETWESNEDGTVWTFHLRPGVTFHDGSTFDANDVVTTFMAQWDFDSGMHTGRTGDFYYFNADFGCVPQRSAADGGVSRTNSREGRAARPAPFPLPSRSATLSDGPLRTAKTLAVDPGPDRDPRVGVHDRPAGARRPVSGGARRAGDRGCL